MTSRIFTLVADLEPPRDAVALGAGRAVDQLPARVRRRGGPVDLDHVVLPLDPAGRGVVVAVAVGVRRVIVMLIGVVLHGGSGSCE